MMRVRGVEWGGWWIRGKEDNTRVKKENGRRICVHPKEREKEKEINKCLREKE